MVECYEHGEMLCYGQHGKIRIYRCEQVYGTHREVWVHDNGNMKEVEPHLYIKSERGQEIVNDLGIYNTKLRRKDIEHGLKQAKNFARKIKKLDRLVDERL